MTILSSFKPDPSVGAISALAGAIALALAIVSDIHLGHRRNAAQAIVENLYREFPDNEETGRLNAIFLAGDVFDDLLQLSDEEIDVIDFWIADFLRMCKKWGIVVRILEGTPSHDWKQSRRFVTMNEAARIGADLKYVSTLSIEYIEPLGIQVLYVPDEWELTTDKTLAQVRELLEAKGLDKVDYAIMHGQFGHQLPSHVKAPSHDSKAYLDLVSEYIFIGHVHTYSKYDRIIAQGSFDRLAHGEESPKGHVRLYKYESGDSVLEFRENRGAKQFVTLKCCGMDLEQTLKLIHERVPTLPDGSFVRIESESSNPVFSNMDLLIRAYPFITFSKLSHELEADELAVVETTEVFTPIQITRDNLHGLVMDRVIRAGPRREVLERADLLLREAV
jgi:DNA repair exonuclease SbcCD nuclease subunit